MRKMPTMIVWAAGLLVLGCGKSGTHESSISGTVTYKNKPVTGGSMFFHAKERAFPASLNTDGSYSCASLPAGEYIVTVDTRALKNMGDPTAMMKQMSGQDPSSQKMPASLTKDLAKMKQEMKGAPQYTEIPEKYADPKTSGIKVTVESGKNQKDIPLTD